jgi:hypothetical protein
VKIENHERMEKAVDMEKKPIKVNRKIKISDWS